MKMLGLMSDDEAKSIVEKFEKNGWRRFSVGKCEIRVRASGKIESVHHGRVNRFASKAEEYINARPKIKAELEKWLAERAFAISAWKHYTPHHRYEADIGCLAVRVNGSACVFVENGIGDGNYPVYILKRGECSIPPTFNMSNVVLWRSSIEVMDYDCETAKPLTAPIDALKVSFLTDGNGAVIVFLED